MDRLADSAARWWRCKLHRYLTNAHTAAYSVPRKQSCARGLTRLVGGGVLRLLNVMHLQYAPNLCLQNKDPASLETKLHMRGLTLLVGGGVLRLLTCYASAVHTPTCVCKTRMQGWHPGARYTTKNKAVHAASPCWLVAVC
jgi:hypothetical protein